MTNPAAHPLVGEPCHHCGFPIVSIEVRFALAVDGLVFCGKGCHAGHLKTPNRDASGYPHPDRYGHEGDRESWVQWALFDNADIGLELNDDPGPSACPMRLAESLTGWSRFYGGPGRGFGSDPYAVVGRFHTLVKQSGGLDI